MESFSPRTVRLSTTAFRDPDFRGLPKGGFVLGVLSSRPGAPS
jgi:hypothetical protein